MAGKRKFRHVKEGHIQKKTGEKIYFSYAIAGKSLKDRLLYSNMRKVWMRL